jgi:hypothetical protein
MRAFRALIEYRCFEPESSFTVPINRKIRVSIFFRIQMLSGGESEDERAVIMISEEKSA